MDLTLVKYNTKHLTKKEKTDFSRKIFGFQDKSNRGTYFYNREGSLTNYIYDKVGKSVFLIETKHEKKIIKEMYKYKIPLTLIKLVLKKKS